jgi:hypothetical protein
MKDQDVGVRRAMSRNRIIGAMVFDYTINSEGYFEEILFFNPSLEI